MAHCKGSNDHDFDDTVYKPSIRRSEVSIHPPDGLGDTLVGTQELQGAAGSCKTPFRPGTHDGVLLQSLEGLLRAQA
jgi:hypothetical protein